MELMLKNIGKLSSASVEINGITVVAGANNTGKSTVGRALFAVHNCFGTGQSRIFNERVASVENQLNRMYRHSRASALGTIVNTELARAIVAHVDKCRQDKSSATKKSISELIFQYDEVKDGLLDQDVFADCVEQIDNILNISDDDILKHLLEQMLNSEFNEQVCNIYSEDDGEIQIKFQDAVLDVFIENGGSVNIHNPTNISFSTEAIYIDDPFVLDNLRIPYLSEPSLVLDHRLHLCSKLVGTSHQANVVDEIIVKDRLKPIYEKLAAVCSGDVIRTKRLMMGYRSKGSDKVLNIRNLSSSLKTFVLLKILLSKGIIEQNGTIIWDEPETHLHPEGQLLLAELIVLLQKEFGLHVLLNTHSPYFMRAIQVYSAKYETADLCKYYLSEVMDKRSIIRDVSNNIESVYEKLSRPFQRLENERWEDV